MLTRSEGLIIKHIKEYIHRPQLWKRSIHWKQANFVEFILTRERNETWNKDHVKGGKYKFNRLHYCRPQCIPINDNTLQFIHVSWKPQYTQLHTLKTTIHQRSSFRKNVYSSPITIISLLRIRSVQHAVEIRQRQVADYRVQFIDFFVTLLIPGSFLVQIHSQSSVECYLKMQLTRTKIDFRLIFFKHLP